MTDVLSSVQRHKNMSRIKSRNTKPEMILRKVLFHEGIRYRLHVNKLPGTPDIVLPKYRTAIFVNGCFWHGHEGCRYYTIPKTNTEFWTNKIERNRERDKKDISKLKEMGWHTVIIWECQLKTACREDFVKSLLFTLNHIQLLNLGAKGNCYHP